MKLMKASAVFLIIGGVLLGAFSLGMAIGSYTTANKYVGWNASGMQIQRGHFWMLIRIACKAPGLSGAHRAGMCNLTNEEVMAGFLPVFMWGEDTFDSTSVVIPRFKERTL